MTARALSAPRRRRDVVVRGVGGVEGVEGEEANGAEVSKADEEADGLSPPFQLALRRPNNGHRPLPPPRSLRIQPHQPTRLRIFLPASPQPTTTPSLNSRRSHTPSEWLATRQRARSTLAARCSGLTRPHGQRWVERTDTAVARRRPASTASEERLEHIRRRMEEELRRRPTRLISRTQGTAPRIGSKERTAETAGTAMVSIRDRGARREATGRVRGREDRASRVGTQVQEEAEAGGEACIA